MRARLVHAVFAFLILSDLAGVVRASAIKADEKIVFFPTIGSHLAKEGVWECDIHGVVFEPEQRRISLAVLRTALAIHHDKLNAAEEATFKERTRAFMVDNERRKEISVQIGDQVFPVGRSGANGHFTGKLRLDDALVERIHSRQHLPFTAVLAQGDERVFSGNVLLLDASGVSIISDIDDTIKISQVRERKKLLANTFYRPFTPVPGMAEVYQRWEKSLGADVHYVSASPWQLFEALDQFAHTNGFPAGTFHMKQFRVKDESFLNLFESPELYKLNVIQPMLKRFPQRRFILVGDSGEKDPETYGTLARRYPDQIAHIYIRDVTAEAADGPRYREAFKGLPPSLWQVFREPGEIP